MRIHSGPLVDDNNPGKPQLYRKKGWEPPTELQGRRLNETLKGPGDLLTRADLASHAFLQSELANCFPELPLILEEQANAIIPDTACIVGDELVDRFPHHLRFGSLEFRLGTL